MTGNSSGFSVHQCRFQGITYAVGGGSIHLTALFLRYRQLGRFPNPETRNPLQEGVNQVIKPLCQAERSQGEPVLGLQRFAVAETHASHCPGNNPVQWSVHPGS